jgi:hypothetical protein
MIRVDKIKDSFFGEVGFRNSTVAGYDIVDNDNKASVSGLFFQDVSRLVTIKNIKDTQENPDITDPQFNDLLKQLQDTAILNVCNKVSQGKSDFIQSDNLFPFEKTFDQTLATSNRFIGFRIEPIYIIDLISKVNWIEASFDKAVTFNLYLYNSNKPNAAIKTKSVTTIANESVIVNINDWFIADNESYKGGTFYLGYFEDDLSGAKPIKRNFEIANLQTHTKCYDVLAVSLEHVGTVIDVSSDVNLSDTGGLNIGMDIYTDYTELFIRNKSLFSQAIQHEMAIEVLGIISKSTRSNRTERITRDFLKQINLELYGYKDENVFIMGLIAKHGRLIADLRKSFFRQPKISKGTLR